ncbi:MAG: glutathione S-transferase family protein [Pseudomonadales bacterium]|nr:glutathione S-transferase family protein [Pseudomonadales bacterium]
MLKLHQFQSSHFNEKVRWALDFKGIAHTRESYLPGPHRMKIKRLSGGPATTPLLQHEQGCVSGSAAIIDWLEARYPEPPLYPAEEPQKQQALAMQSQWDATLGPATRTVVFSVLQQVPTYLCATFSRGKPLAKRLGYRALYPMVSPLIAKANGVNPENIERAFHIVETSLDEIAGASSSTGYLVGDRFTVADLTAAALLAPLANVTHPDMRRIEPVPREMSELISRFASHSAIQWVQRVYSTHRPVG